MKMQKIAKNLTELIGNTPILELVNCSKSMGLEANILAKLEYLNPSGSVKCRIGNAMLEDAQKRGLINKDTVIIEPTSGNTGIALAFAAAAKGYSLIITMPETMSVERKKILKAYGAKIILTPGEQGMKGAIKRAQELVEKTPNSFMPSQFTNEANPYTHKKTTAKEILRDTNGQVDIFISGVGTGGTLTGVGEVLREKKPNVKIVAVEPYNSAVLSGGKAGAHSIQGIGAGFIPNIINQSIIDEIFKVKSEDVFSTARYVAKSEGLLVGMSSGAALYVAFKIAKRSESKGKNIVVILPDSGERYLSTDLYLED